MEAILGIGILSAVAAALAVNKAPLWGWAGFLLSSATAVSYASDAGTLLTFLLFLPGLAVAALAIPALSTKLVTRPLYTALRSSFPAISDTEREALAAGTVGWDAELFRGNLNWARLKSIPAVHLNAEERAFLDGPTEQLCRMINDWDIRHNRHDIPEDIWNFIRAKGFLGMLISKQHGGLGFSAQAQSLVLGKIASRSPDIAVVVMVPNSLGPGELVEKYGTQAQKQAYLHRLARGDDIPCFALTSPYAGSDAASMRDVGIVCEGEFNGKEVLGIRLTWDKRYITLAPKATLLGLAFHLYDPERLLGLEQDYAGITVALIPASHEGVVIGNRHLPSGAAFPNGPTSGKDVFIPIDWVIGGREQVGHGWGMLMESLAVGRAISLPGTSTAAIKSMLRTSTAYARTRRQFGIPIGYMEGIEEPLVRLVEDAYTIEAGRAMTASLVGVGQKPSVISALLKYNSTERMRRSISDAMDIHGGRAICDGPSNYLMGAYQSVPVGITVEGANILTRTLITFAQGALRCHPYLYRETEALQSSNSVAGYRQFERAFGEHVRWALANGTSAILHNLTRGRFVRGPGHRPEVEHWYRQLSRASRSFAFVADVTVGLLAGGLKTKQKLTGRLADALSELYLFSAILKRFDDDGEPEEDRLILELCARNSLHRFDTALKGVIDNFPIRPAALLMKLVAQPLGLSYAPASDRLARKVVAKVLAPGEVRDRLTRDIYVNHDPEDPTGILEVAFERAVELERAEKAIDKAVRAGRIHRHHRADWFADAVAEGIITVEEADKLREYEALLARVIAVDDFPAEAVVPHFITPDLDSEGQGSRNRLAAE